MRNTHSSCTTTCLAQSTHCELLPLLSLLLLWCKICCGDRAETARCAHSHISRHHHFYCVRKKQLISVVHLQFHGLVRAAPATVWSSQWERGPGLHVDVLASEKLSFCELLEGTPWRIKAEFQSSVCISIPWGSSLKCSFLGSVGYWVGLYHLHFNQTPLSNSAAVSLDGSHLGDTAWEFWEVRTHSSDIFLDWWNS